MPGPLLESLRRARHVAVLTGSRVSARAAADLPRRAHRPVGPHRPEDLATAEAFERDTATVWARIDAPGGGARRGPQRRPPRAGGLGGSASAGLFTLLTQNVDGLHRRAGSRNVVELHGDLTRARCSREGSVGTGGRSRRTAASRPDVRAAVRTCVPTWCGSVSSCRSRRSTRRGPRSTTGRVPRGGDVEPGRAGGEPALAGGGAGCRGGGGQYLDGGTALGGGDPSSDRAGGAGAAGAAAGGVALLTAWPGYAASLYSAPARPGSSVGRAAD